MTQTQSKELVTKEMIIGEVIEKYPDAAGVFSSYGIQCIGCHANPHEAIEQGALGHGMSEEEIDKMINEVNSVISGGEDHTEEHHQEEAEEDPSKLRIDLTERAAEKVKGLMKKQKQEGYGLRIKVSAGGCAGLSYGLEIEKEPDVQKDRIFDFHGVKVFLDGKSLQILNGTSIDYIETLKESGFKFNNPNAKSSCGCGSSFS